jgi:chemotaxis protein CheX
MISKSTKRVSGTPEGAFGLIHRHLSAAIIEVFRDYQVEACRGKHGSSAPTTGNVVVTVIGFAGDKMRGSLVLKASVASVDCWRAPLGAVDSTTDTRDILGELANMVLGRLKGKLLPEGLLILMSTPTTACGHEVLLARAVGPEERLVFCGDGWLLSARVDAEFDDDFGLQEAPAAVAAQAGDIMIF